jgi:hypothetical protein
MLEEGPQPWGEVGLILPGCTLSQKRHIKKRPTANQKNVCQLEGGLELEHPKIQDRNPWGEVCSRCIKKRMLKRARQQPPLKMFNKNLHSHKGLNPGARWVSRLQAYLALQT